MKKKSKFKEKIKKEYERGIPYFKEVKEAQKEK